MNRAVFLDRDNTIIHNDGDLGDAEQVRLIQGAASAIASLCGLGYKIVVVTNQGGVARGKYGEAEVERVHERLAELVRQGANGARIDRFYYCPYHPEGTVEAYRCEHPSRKPQPGMLLEAAEDLRLDLEQCWMIGDQLRDVQAGIAAGTRTILLRPQANEPGQEGATGAGGEGEPDYIVRTLVEAVRVVAQARHPESAEPMHQAYVAGKRWDAAAVAKLQQAPPRPRQSPEPIKPTPPAAAEPTKVNEPPPERRAAAASSRPFHPWGASPLPEPGAGPGASSELGQVVRDKLRRFRGLDKPTQAVPDSEAPPSEVPPEASSTHPEAPADQASPAQDQDQEPPSVAATVEPGSSSTPPQRSTDQTLRLILQELRGQRGAQDEFSYLYVVAVVLQMVAGICLLGALWMGAADAGLLVRWLGAGLMVQLATIAMLLFARNR